MARLGLEPVIAIWFGILGINIGLCYSEKAPKYTFVKEASEAAEVSHYDYIIIGGGTAGCPLAATLSQNFNVLLLERGGVPYGNNNISRIENYAKTLADISPTSASQRFVSEDGVINARARVLGGGSCLNAGFYTRASPEYVRKAGWDAKLVNESYPWVEKFVAHRPPLRQWQTAVRDALLDVGILPDNGFTYDHIYGTKVGGTIFDDGGNRHTAADLLEYADPHKLTVLLHATVHRVLFATKGKSKPMAHGVVYRDSNGQKHRAYLKKGAGNEIIISAGALGSPQLLMLSGIGPAEHLRSLGIPVVVDLAAVGQGMADNPMNAIFVPSPIPVEVSLIQVVGITKYGSYIETVSGINLLAAIVMQDLGMNMASSKVVNKVQSVQNQKAEEPVPVFRGGYLLEKVIGPLSSGFLRLRNRRVEDNPSVTFNYFEEPEDLKRCVEGIRTIESVLKSRHLADFMYPDLTIADLKSFMTKIQINLRPKQSNDTNTTSLEQFCKETVITIYHYHGGCQVGHVVDQKYRVLGVDALRVIDGSTFNFSPGTNPQATVMMLGS